MIAASREAFAAAVDEYRFDDVALDGATLERAAAVVAETGLLLVGEPHGVHETPAVLYALAGAVGTRAVAFEWSHDELHAPLQELLEEGVFAADRLWALPASAEIFAGDGRVTAGHFALLGRLRSEGRLDQAIAFDRLDPDPMPEWHVRDRDMSDRLLAQWDRRLPLLAVAGAFHARLDIAQTMASNLAVELPGLQAAMLEFDGMPEPMPPAPIVFRLGAATPATVPAYRPRP